MPRNRIKDLPEFARPRERLVGRGPEALSDAELLAVLLRTGVEGRSAVELARRLSEKAGRSLPPLRCVEGARGTMAFVRADRWIRKASPPA